jgi:hypothetical protein
VFDLHEDPTDEAAEGFEQEQPPTAIYMYEQYPADDPGLGRSVLQKLRAEGLEIWDGQMVYGFPCDQGLIRQFQTGSGNITWLQGSFDEYMLARSRHVLTFETPTCWDIGDRIGAHLRFLRIALEMLKG